MGFGGDGDYAYQNAALYKAWEKLKNTGGIVVVCGPYTLEEKHSNPQARAGDMDIIMNEWFQNRDVSILYTSVYDGVDYRQTADAKVIFKGKACLTFPTATYTKNITFQGSISAVEGRHTWIAGGFCPLTLATGTKFLPNSAGELPYIVGGFRNGNGIGVTTNELHNCDRTDIVVDIGNENEIGHIYGIIGMLSHAPVADANITLRSGTFTGPIIGDSWGGDPTKLTNANMNIKVLGGIIKGEIAATNNGFAADSTKKVSIMIAGGDLTDCTGILAKGTECSRSAPANFKIDCTYATDDLYQLVKAKAPAGVTIVEPDPNAVMPGTGDNAALIPAIILMAVCFVAAYALIVSKKKVQ